MSSNTSSKHEEFLQKLHEEIDMPPDIFTKIEQKYKDLGEWLDRTDSTIKDKDPFVAPQGSVLLGTANKPIGDHDEYDVDLICQLNNLRKDGITQKGLKESVGHEICRYADARGMTHPPDNNRRCWTLDYDDDRRFHVDVLPCIPDTEDYQGRLLEKSHTELAENKSITDKAIAITDKTDSNYDAPTQDWPSSNPLGYYEWFKERMEKQFRVEKQRVFESQTLIKLVDDIPDYQVKTTLQKAIQLLKRHRDTMFADDDNEIKPISIIITTLAAHAYNNETTLVDALETILNRMENFIEQREGVDWIANPVNPEENFADKWAEKKEKKEQFERWLEEARRDFGAYINASPNEIPPKLADRLGKIDVEKIIKELGGRITIPAVVATNTTSRAEKMVNEVINKGTDTKPYGTKTLCVKRR